MNIDDDANDYDDVAVSIAAVVNLFRTCSLSERVMFIWK